MWPLPLAGAVAGAGALLGWRLGALRPSGLVAALLVGTAILAGLGTAGAAVLGTFFVGASAASHLLERPTSLDSKDGRRDAWQVLANGAVAALAAGAAPAIGTTPALWVATTALAAAAADTFATAFGTTSPHPPRLLLTGERVPVGTNGGITLRGTLGGALGAGLVATAGALGGGGPRLAVVATVLGVAWMLGDSLLGAAWQGRFHCGRCAGPAERRVHRCGTPTSHVGGFRWLTNDGVNLLATAGAGLDAALWWWLCS